MPRVIAIKERLRWTTDTSGGPGMIAFISKSQGQNIIRKLNLVKWDINQWGIGPDDANFIIVELDPSGTGSGEWVAIVNAPTSSELRDKQSMVDRAA